MVDMGERFLFFIKSVIVLSVNIFLSDFRLYKRTSRSFRTIRESKFPRQVPARQSLYVEDYRACRNKEDRSQVSQF